MIAIALEIMDRPWAWGSADCCTSACDVFAEWHGVDPMASLRGAYSTGVGAARMIARAGGLRALAVDLASEAGLQPGTGEVGEIGVWRRSLVVCAAPGVWLGKTLSGMARVPAAEISWNA